jgi:hypothetical protein
MFSLVAVWYGAKKAEWDARKLLQDSVKLKVGVSSAQEVLAIIHGPSRKTEGFEECIAGHQDCYGDVAVRNRLLNLIGLAPDIGFGSILLIKNNVLISQNLKMVAIIDGNDLHAFAREEQAGPGEPAFHLERNHNSLLGVVMTPAAGDEFRKRATDFNLRCLSKIGGCKTMEEMLPILRREDLVQP